MIFFSEHSPIQIALWIICLPVLLFAVWQLRLSVGEEELRPEADSTRDKRRAKRTKSNAVFDLDDGEGHFTTSNASLVDMSVWGACITTIVPLRKGQSIRGRVRSSTEGRLEVVGHVIWFKSVAGTMYYGIAFDKVNRLSD